MDLTYNDIVDGVKTNNLGIRTQESIFMNSTALFVEYHDIIKSPQLLLLTTLIKHKDKFEKFLDLSPIEGLDKSGLVEWYYHRKTQNIMEELMRPEIYDHVDTTGLDKLLNNQLSQTDMFIKYSDVLNFGKVISDIIYSKNLVKNIYIYNKYDNEYIKDDLKNLYEGKVTFVYGELEDVIKNIPPDTTYVFSDMLNISRLADMDRLNYSSVIVPYDYDYNKNGSDEYIVDISKYMEEYVFKFNFFYASYDM